MNPPPWHDLAAHSGTSRLLVNIVEANRRSQRVGIFSVCSASRFVLEACMAQARRDDTVVLLESTSNQVNQVGGYTGMTPADFRQFVTSVAADMGFPASRVVLGGDHLGPHPWRSEPAHAAMAKASQLVRDCVLAGYTKIHIDTSMRLADDPADTPLDMAVVVERTSELCEVAEAAHATLPPGSEPPVYVVGNEVPVPGGELAGQAAPAVTKPDDVTTMLRLTRELFGRRGLRAAWDRVIAIVVQPGVEFGDATIFDYDRAAARELTSLIERDWPMVYEAHSTDYQTSEALGALVEDHFAILKVGPGLTFAMREALFALEAIEREVLADPHDMKVSRLRDVIQQAMIEDPEHWKSYYAGSEDELHFARDFSFSDRSRYYWPRPEVRTSVAALVRNLSERAIPLALLSQYMPAQYNAVRTGALRNDPIELIRGKILEVADVYAHACGMR